MTVVSFQYLTASTEGEPKRYFNVKGGEIDLETFHVPDNQLLVQVKAWALNPVDWKLAAYKLSKDGVVPGNDLSGTVVKVGRDVNDPTNVGCVDKPFNVGDDVAALVPGGIYPDTKAPGAFSGYVLVDDFATFNFGKNGLGIAADRDGEIPSGKMKSFEGAASMPLSLCTAATVLSNSFELGGEGRINSEGQNLLIWGGSTIVGVMAIQIARHLYKMNVIAVASKKHHSFLQMLGATATYDYNTENVAETIKAEHNYIEYGFDAVSQKDTFQNVYDIVANDAIITNLLGLGEKDLKTQAGKTVTVHDVNVYEIFGKDIYFGPNPIKSAEGVRLDFDFFRRHRLTKDFVRNQLIHPKLRVINDNHSFLKSIETGLDLFKDNKISCEKVVIRATDVEN